MLAAKVHGHDGSEAPDDQIGSVDDDPFLRDVTRLGRVSRHRDFLEIWRVSAGYGGACVAGILGASSVAEFVNKISHLCFRYHNTDHRSPAKYRLRARASVMAGLDPATQRSRAGRELFWVPGSSPGMTEP